MNQPHLATAIRRRLAAAGDVHDHLVGFYESETFLASSIGEFCVPALLAGSHAAVIVATAQHRRSLERSFTNAGLDLDTARDRDQLIMIDAREVLDQALVGDHLDRQRLEQRLRPTFERAARGGRRIRIVCELGALLWEAGDLEAAAGVEAFLHEMIGSDVADVLCVYPSALVETEDRTLPFLTLCEQHTGVLPGEDYAVLPDGDARLRWIALLQQEAVAARTERRALQQQKLELDAARTDGSDADERRNDALLTSFAAMQRCVDAAAQLVADLRLGVVTGGEINQQALTVLDGHHLRLRTLLDHHHARWLDPPADTEPSLGHHLGAPAGIHPPGRQPRLRIV
ncbi:MAG: MEDS domain-containing protein [Egicoccus sp.]